ncbi:Na+/H+ antiporter subunit E [Bordetella genomosp. 13]|uniref:Na+/H+ antiporter subunit E n=1 Tax=Bordetella genomosp. 13 TaxID=463040 RepID=UPI00119E4E60|nr:Na+/H+ antiporter subunit E [Bordetella genomosp. 13]
MRRDQLFILPLFLLVLWLVLNQSLSAGQVVLGAGLAIWLAWASLRLRPLGSRPRRLWRLAPLSARMVLEIVKSNIAVAKLIWRPGRELTPGFITVPLRLRDPHGLAVLVCCLTYTPGTVVVDLKRGQSVTLHVLDLQNEEEWVELIQQRYERTLMEVFE